MAPAGLHICDECVETCAEILRESRIQGTERVGDGNSRCDPLRKR